MNAEQYCSDAANRFREKVFNREAKSGIHYTDYELELASLREAPFGKKVNGQWIKSEFMLNCFRFQWQDFLHIEVDGYENTYLKRIVRGFCRWHVLDLLGTAASGKTMVASACGYTIWKCSPWNTSLFLSTTSMEAGGVRTWGYVKDLHEKDKFRVGVRLEYRSMIVLQEDPKNKERDYRDAISAVAIKKGAEGRDAIGTISGRHNTNVIWICDEFPHMDIGVLEGRLNTLANEHGQFVGIGNRPKEGDPMFIDAEPKGGKYPFGWKSISPDNPPQQWWTTQAGACYYFDGEKSPNLQAPEDAPVPFPYLMNRKMIATIEKASGGKDSLGYWGQVKGFPINGEIQDTVLNGALIKARGADQQAVWGIEPPKCIAGLDLGFRADGDPTIADFALIGKDIEGKTILQYERDGIKIRTKPSDMRPYEEQIAEGFLNECRSRDCHDCELDVSADGGIIAQAIAQKARELGYSMKLVLCSSMGRPGKEHEDVFYEVGDERKEAKTLFDRKVSELWYSLRFSVQNGVIRGMNSESIAVKQLVERKLHVDDKKRYAVEGKKEMKKRIKRSCDNADARVYCHSLAMKMGLSGAGRSSIKTSKPKAVHIKETVPKSRYGWKQPKRKMYAGR